MKEMNCYNGNNYKMKIVIRFLKWKFIFTSKKYFSSNMPHAQAPWVDDFNSLDRNVLWVSRVKIQTTC